MIQLRHFAALAALLLAVPVLAAQGVPNLSGTWVLQADKSDFGQMPGPTARQDVIDHQEPKLTVQRTVTGPQGETMANLAYVVDGNPHKNMAGPTEVTSTLRWEGAVLVMSSVAAGAQGEVQITDRYSLSEDGKTLTQERTFSFQGQELRQTMVLARQP